MPNMFEVEIRLADNQVLLYFVINECVDQDSNSWGW